MHLVALDAPHAAAGPAAAAVVAACGWLHTVRSLVPQPLYLAAVAAEEVHLEACKLGPRLTAHTRLGRLLCGLFGGD